MIKKLAVSVLGLGLAASIASAAVNTQWLTFTGINDESGNPLPVGSVVQLINAGGNGAPDALDWINDPVNYIGGDDVLVDSIQVGDGVGGLEGYFVGGPARYDDVASTDTLFIRAFNLPQVEGAQSGWYGQGGMTSGFANPDGSPPPPPDSVVWNDGATNQEFIVPEPSTVLLALAGLGLLAARLRRK